MNHYVAPHHPEYSFISGSKNERKARYIASQELSNLVNDKSLGLKMPNGFSTRQFIEISEEDLMPKNKEEIFAAVKILAKLSISKQRVHELHGQSVEFNDCIDILFEDKPLTQDDFKKIKKSLKKIKDYAISLASYKEALSQAEEAREYLKNVLESPE